MTTEMASPGLVGPQEHHAQIRGDGSDVGEARNGIEKGLRHLELPPLTDWR